MSAFFPSARTSQTDDPLDHLLDLHPELAAALDRPDSEEGAAALAQLADLLRGRNRATYGAKSAPPPTDALPGTPEKAERLRERVAAKLATFAPGDLGGEGWSAALDGSGVEDENGCGDDALGILPPEATLNGVATRNCIEGKAPLAAKAQATTGKRVGGEKEIRAILDERRRTEQEARRRERAEKHWAEGAAVKQTCNKCKGKGSYRTTADGQRIDCSRCQGTGLMDRVTKAQKRDRKAKRAAKKEG